MGHAASPPGSFLASLSFLKIPFTPRALLHRERCAQLHRFFILLVLQVPGTQSRVCWGAALRLLKFSNQKRYRCNKMQRPRFGRISIAYLALALDRYPGQYQSRLTAKQPGAAAGNMNCLGNASPNSPTCSLLRILVYVTTEIIAAPRSAGQKLTYFFPIRGDVSLLVCGQHSFSRDGTASLARPIVDRIVTGGGHSGMPLDPG